MKLAHAPTLSPFSHHHLKRSKLALAYGISTGVGVTGLLAIVLVIVSLRYRHKRRRAAGIVPDTEADARRYCVCKECSGCLRKIGGGDGSRVCGKCGRGVESGGCV